MQRDIRELRSEVASLKRLMSMSFDLQRDIQRSIRQELAAALDNRPEGEDILMRTKNISMKIHRIMSIMY